MEKNPKLCRRLLEIILGKKIKKIHFVETERQIELLPGGKGVRLDVYVDDEEGTVYNIEMQTVFYRNLPRRTRYYQGMIDLNLLEKGADYDNLRESIVIFICTFDPFHEGIPVYTFTNRCHEQPELELGDGTTKLFLNPCGNREGLNEDLAAFLDYLQGRVTEGNSFVNSLEEEVAAAREHKEWRVEYMTLMMEYRERYKEGFEEGIQHGMEQGMEQGIGRGKAEDILDFLEDDGEVPEQLRERIYAQTDSNILRRWLKLAARASSIEEFEKEIGR